MASEKKTVISGKVKKEGKGKFKVEKGNEKDHEVDIDIDIDENGDYEVEKLSIADLPETMGDGTKIRWLNNFAIKQNGKYIKKKYTVTIPGLSKRGTSRLVICGSNNEPYYYKGTITGDTFELTDGDPGVGFQP